ncbi:unnamed protein product [Calicophoron daubneyi]|uniref:WKF domain-containing protein n=1 Tax=Calicophoron daubneyi TaxID=300641 RepID=A0AAV2T2V1_CALDB
MLTSSGYLLLYHLYFKDSHTLLKKISSKDAWALQSSDNDAHKVATAGRRSLNFTKRTRWKKRRAKKIHGRKEREAIKQAALESNTGSTHQRKALGYLHQWYANREDWKFRKIQQAWLIKHALDTKLVDSDDFRIFIRYAKKIVGRARETLSGICDEAIEQFQNSDQSGPDENRETEENMNASDRESRAVSFKRASRIKKLLSKTEQKER